MITSLQEATGIPNTSTDARNQLLRYLNTAGREIWNTKDIPGSTVEQFFTVPTNDTTGVVLMTLPWYCDGLRACRWALTGDKITLNDTRPRYHSTPWKQPFLTWRIKQRVPLATSLSVVGPVTFTLALAQADAVNITVSGATSTSTSVSETVTILAGGLTATTTSQWSADGITSITKNVITTVDVAITDAGGINVGIIPARQPKANNILVQISDEYAPISYEPDGVIEVLYKLPYQELYFDGDTFGESYLEDALVWRARANYEALKLDDNALNRASVLAAKANEILGQIIVNQESEAEMVVNFAPNRYHRLMGFARRGRLMTGRFFA